MIQRVGTFVGFSPYEFGIDPLTELRAATKEGKKQKKGGTTSSKRCVGVKSGGGQCKNNAAEGSNYCWIHK